MPQRPLIPTLDDSPTREQIVKAINQLQTGKAPGSDGIPTNQVVKLSSTGWPACSKPFGRRGCCKGEKAVCDNHRGREIPGTHTAEQDHWASSGQSGLRESLLLQTEQRYRHGLYNQTAAGKVHQTEARPVSALHKPDQGLRHCQQTRPLVHPVQTKVSSEVCQCRTVFPWQHDGQSDRERRYL